MLLEKTTLSRYVCYKLYSGIDNQIQRQQNRTIASGLRRPRRIHPLAYIRGSRSESLTSFLSRWQVSHGSASLLLELGNVHACVLNCMRVEFNILLLAVNNILSDCERRNFGVMFTTSVEKTRSESIATGVEEINMFRFSCMQSENYKNFNYIRKDLCRKYTTWCCEVQYHVNTQWCIE